MASAYKCDRCGNFYDQHAYNEPRFCACRANGLKVGMKLDLCPGCSRDLADWLDRKAFITRQPIPEVKYVEKPECPEYIERLEYPADEVDDE